MVRPLNSIVGRVLLLVPAVWAALDVDINNEDSIKKAAALVAEDLMSYYIGEKPNEIPGILPGPRPMGNYYWWSGGLLWNTLIDYRNVTGDTKYTDSIVKGMEWQMGDHHDFVPANWTLNLSNGDQGTWANAALAAAMAGLPSPSKSQETPDWLSVARTVVDEQSLRRLNNGTCKGALRFAIYQVMNGYNYLDTNSNANYFALTAGLAHATKNDTLAKQAASTYDMMTTAGWIDNDFNVFDGAQTENDCKLINKLQFSQNPGLLLTGAAYMFQQTNSDETWKKRIDGLLDRTLKFFFPDGVAKEVACERNGQCIIDMKMYKGMLHRALGKTMQLAPYTKDKILPVLKTSAAAAVKTCTEGQNQRLCSAYWAEDSDVEAGAKDGAAAQLAVLNALNSVLMANPQSGGNGSSPAGGSGSNAGGNGQEGSTDATGGKKDSPGSMGASTTVSTAALFGGLFFGALALF
ncbi:glycoside hydrolase family 76 protein [Apiospora arundinis]